MKRTILILLIIFAAGPIFLYSTVWSVLIPPAREAIAGIRPVADKTDYWQQGWETRQRGAGDCEDFAILIGERYEQDGIGFRMAVIDMGNGPHMVLLTGGYYIDSIRPKLIPIKKYPAIKIYTWKEVRSIL